MIFPVLRPQRDRQRRDIDMARTDMAAHRQRRRGPGRLADHHEKVSADTGDPIG